MSGAHGFDGFREELGISTDDPIYRWIRVAWNSAILDATKCALDQSEKPECPERARYIAEEIQKLYKVENEQTEEAA